MLHDLRGRLSLSRALAVSLLLVPREARVLAHGGSSLAIKALRTSDSEGLCLAR
jgi:hypothetical protein